MEKYSHYEIEDFVLDNDFRKSIAAPNTFSDLYWNNFLNEFPDKQETVKEARRIILSLEPAENVIPESRLNNIWNKINQTRKRRVLGVSHQLLKYAAVFVFALLFSSLGLFFIQKPENDFTRTYTEINVPYGEKSEITLYDGTKVWLNSGTKLRFPIVFNSEKRNVYIEGEAFFDVAKNKGKPFIVDAGQMSIKVLGTRFNVCAYPEDKEYQATLEEGKILAYSNSTNKTYELNPGQQASLDLLSQKMSIKQVETDLYTSWKENKLKFKDAPFSNVIKKMERWYDVTINVEETNSFEKRYNMTIKTESLREMLQLISFTTPINYEINEDNVFISRK